MKIEEFISSILSEQTVEKPSLLVEPTKIMRIFSRYKNLVFSIGYANPQKKETKDPKDSPLLITDIPTS
nr:hypothetical protein [Deltaproteobacteria bacterium]